MTRPDLPFKCQHCGADLPPATQVSKAACPKETYTLTKWEYENGVSVVTVECPTCLRCSKGTVLKLKVGD